MPNFLQTVTDTIYGVRADFEAVSVDRSINFLREAGFAVQQLRGNDYSLKIAYENPDAVIEAVKNVGAIGISLNPALKLAYLVPRKGGICLDMSYMGLIHLAIDSGSIKWARAEIVFAEDTFALNNLDELPSHQFEPFSTERGDVVGAYVVVKTRDDEYLTHTMAVADINSIRDRSESWKRNAPGKRGPWETDYKEMAKKTVVKQASKYWPKSERLDRAVHYLNTDGGEGLPALPGPGGAGQCPEDLLRRWTDKASKARTAEALTQVWKAGLVEIRPTRDMRAYDTFKEAVAARGEAFKTPADDGKTVDMEPPAQAKKEAPRARRAPPPGDAPPPESDQNHDDFVSEMDEADAQANARARAAGEQENGQ